MGWPDRRLTDLFGTPAPIIQAPMAGSNGSALAIGAIEGGGLGSLPCATITPERAREEVAAVRGAVGGPVNLNFFCHRPSDPPDESRWRAAQEDVRQAQASWSRIGVVAEPARRALSDRFQRACRVVLERPVGAAESSGAGRPGRPPGPARPAGSGRPGPPGRG